MDAINLLDQINVGQMVDITNNVSSVANLGADNKEFSSYMADNNNHDIVATANTGNVDSKTEYEQYKYKEKNIEVSDKTPREELKEEISEKLDEIEQTIIDIVTSDLDIDEFELVEALQNLGIAPIGLIEQQNLVQISVELEISNEPTELLLNSDFQKMMTDINQYVSDTIAEFEVDFNQFTELIAEMDLVTDNDLGIEFEQLLNDAGDILSNVEAIVEHTGDVQVQNIVNNQDMDNVEAVITLDSEAITGQSDINAKEDADIDSKLSEETYYGTDSLVKTQGNESSNNLNGQNEDNKSSDEHSNEFDGLKNESIVVNYEGLNNINFDQNLEVNELDYIQDRYISFDTKELISQIVENVRVSVLDEASSIEMRLNPENLGKVYVNITSKEGTVSAQFTASNDAVREALESQIITLKENLSQAGVKVDAVEVTVSSHGFERNLEQDQSRQKQEGQRQEELASSRRRSINLSSMDELVGLMTEEEALLAQIMIDNGNSVDLTA